MMEPWIRERVIQHPRGANQSSLVRARQLCLGKEDQPNLQQGALARGRQVAVVRGKCQLFARVVSDIHALLTVPQCATMVCNECGTSSLLRLFRVRQKVNSYCFLRILTK